MDSDQNELRGKAKFPDLTVWVLSPQRSFVSDILSKAETALAGRNPEMLPKIKIIEGFEELQNYPKVGNFLFYIPQGGIGKEVHRAASSCQFPFFFRFFSEEQLLDGESHSISDVRNQLAEEFPPDFKCSEGFAPDAKILGRVFLGWQGDLESEQAFFEWICSVFNFFAENNTHERALEILKTLDAFAGSVFLHLKELPLECDRMSFGTTLALAGIGDLWTKRINACRQEAVEAASRRDALNSSRGQNTWKEYERNIRKNNPEARITHWPLGQEHVSMLESLDGLIKALGESPYTSTKSLGVTLASLLKSKPPTLAVVGSFSSGKTTLLNNVILGERPGCAFRTSHTANTAIVYEIVSCGSETESVEFTFFEQIEHVLFDVDGVGETWGKYQKMLLEMLDKKILQIPEISFETVTSVHKFTGAKARAFLTEQDQAEARRNAEMEHSHKDPIKRVIFRASVTKNQKLFSTLIEVLGFSKRMNLSSPEDWKIFQGSLNDASGVPTEKDTVSILVKKAVVRLNSPLLRMTSIADTPGTGSSRDRHDYISESYIEHAEAFIILLRTGGDQYSKRAVEILKRIALKYSKSGVSALPRVAFVINTDQKTAEQRDNIDEYLTLAANEFGLTKDHFKKKAKIFAIDLKNTESCSATWLGYPSLKALSEWISSEVFALSAYKERLAKMREVLKTQWESTIRVLEKRLHDGEMQDVDRKNQIKLLKKLVDNEIPEMSEKYLSYASESIAEISEIKKQLLELIKPYTERPYDKDSLNQFKDSAWSFVEEFNKLVKEATDRDTADDWISEIKPLMINASLLLPGLCPPDRREIRFDNGLQISRSRVERSLNKIDDKWPNWWGIYAPKWLGGEDLRCHLAWELHETLREEMDGVIDVFNKYHSQLSSFFEDALSQIETTRDKRIQSLFYVLDSENNSVTDELKTIRSFQKKRRSILKALESILEKDVTIN